MRACVKEFLERVGLSQIQKEPMDRVALREVLRRACQGELRRFDTKGGTARSGEEGGTQTVRRMQAHKCEVLLVACAIGFLTNMPVAIGENFLIFAWDCNGLRDAYWVCNNATVPVAGTVDVMEMGLEFSEIWGIETVEPSDQCDYSSIGTLLGFWWGKTPFTFRPFFHDDIAAGFPKTGSGYSTEN